MEMDVDIRQVCSPGYIVSSYTTKIQRIFTNNKAQFRVLDDELFKVDYLLIQKSSPLRKIKVSGLNVFSIFNGPL